MKPGTWLYRIAAVYIPFLRKLPLPRVLEVAAARKEISMRATKLVRDKQVQTSTTAKDLLSLMVEENRKAEGELEESEVIDQIMTFLLAGHETTSTAVVYLFTSC
jgi:cyclooctat-9-en-7-ol 5-monooxygenase